MIRTGRVHFRDLPAGFAAYLGDLLTVFFLVWVLSLVASLVLAPFPFLRIVFVLACFVFFNAVPELIYLGGHAPAELLVESYRFIGENWIEWFPANIVLARMRRRGPRAARRRRPVFSSRPPPGVVLYFAMIVRGLLFQELATSSRRGREFRRRAAG